MKSLWFSQEKQSAHFESKDVPSDKGEIPLPEATKCVVSFLKSSDVFQGALNGRGLTEKLLLVSKSNAFPPLSTHKPNRQLPNYHYLQNP